MRLEYRYDDEIRKYPGLWHYGNLSKAEAAARMVCEYFVKEGQTFKVTATALDPDGTSVIYVTKESFTNELSDHHYSHIGLEVRELNQQGSSLIEKKEIWDHEEVLAALLSDYIYIEQKGQFLEFTLDSREIDEDRKCYIYYGEFTGKSRNGR